MASEQKIVGVGCGVTLQGRQRKIWKENDAVRERDESVVSLVLEVKRGVWKSYSCCGVLFQERIRM